MLCCIIYYISYIIYYIPYIIYYILYKWIYDGKPTKVEHIPFVTWD